MAERQDLEPYWDTIDGIIEEEIRSSIPSRHFKYFDACAFKLKAIWYLKCRVSDLDARYGKRVDKILAGGNLDKLLRNPDGSWSYFPFFEALEFESLLAQGKACLDCFAKAIGSIFGELPKNISRLERLLNHKQRSGPTPRRTAASELLDHIRVARFRLGGVVIDPGTGRKSIRDLVSHREHASIHFRVTRSGRSAAALVRSDHPEIVRLPNYRVTEISTRVWYHTRTLVENSLQTATRLIQQSSQTSIR